MANKINPNVTDSPPSYDSIENKESYLTQFRNYIQNKSCYHDDALKNGTLLDVTDRSAFEIEMWSLMEKRWTRWNEKPHRNEPTPAHELGELFQDQYSFDTPSVIIKGTQNSTKDLLHCQRSVKCDTCQGLGKYDCLKCRGNMRNDCLDCDHHGYYRNGVVCKSCRGLGTVRCDLCAGSGKRNCDRCDTLGRLLKWPSLFVEWWTEYSISFGQNSFLPDKLIRSAGTKTSCLEPSMVWEKYEIDDKLSETMTRIACSDQPDTGLDLRKIFNEKHRSKVGLQTRIVRLKCSINKVMIREVTYQCESYENKQSASKGEPSERQPTAYDYHLNKNYMLTPFVFCFQVPIFSRF